MVGSFGEPVRADQWDAVDQCPGNGRARQPEVDRLVSVGEGTTDEHDVSGKPSADTSWGCNTGRRRVHHRQSVNGKNGIMGEHGTFPSQEYCLHVPIAVSGRDVIEAVQAPGQALQPTPGRELR